MTSKRKSYEVLIENLVGVLQTKKPVFRAHRVQGEVRVDMDGTTVGRILIEQASDNVGLSFKVKKEYGGILFPVVYGKENQHERKKVAVVCALLMFLLDTSEGRNKKLAESKTWYDSFTNDLHGEITESHKAVRELTATCRTLIDIFALVSDAIKSALGEDLKESLGRVSKELPFLAGRLSIEEWVALYNSAVVDQVHES